MSERPQLGYLLYGPRLGPAKAWVEVLDDREGGRLTRPSASLDREAENPRSESL